MSFNIEVRKKQLHSLQQYINSTKDKVDSILNYLGWTAKAVLETPEKVNCPVNKKHSILSDKLKQHVETCSVVSAGYSLDDQFLSEPQVGSTSSISIDNSKKIEVLNEVRQLNPKFKAAWNGVDTDPMTSDRLFSTFSTDERLALHDYCQCNTQGPPVPEEFTLTVNEYNKKDENELTHEEKLAKERNAKRRPVKYKSVHTGRNKSHTEVMREVIHNQMDMYKDYLIEKRKADEESKLEREQELLAKAKAYEQFPHIDTKVVYDYGIDPFDTSDVNNYLDTTCNGYNVSYDYQADVSLKIENDCIELKNDLEEPNRTEKKDKDSHKYKSSATMYSRERDRRPRSRDKDLKRRSERRSRERREYSKRSREDRRQPYARYERRH